MKIRVAFVFLMLFIAIVFFVFYLKDYFFIQSDIDHLSQRNITQQQVINLFNDNSIELFDFQGSPSNRSQLDKLTHEAQITRIFHFWASWCDPCAVELPELISFVKKENQKKQSGQEFGRDSEGFVRRAGKNTSGLQVYLISVDSEAEGLNKFAKIYPGILSSDFIQVWDKNNVLSNRLSVDKLPMSIFLFSDGKIEIRDGVVNWKNLQL